MPWSSTISSGDVVAIHAALLPTPDGDGEIIMFGGDNHYRDGAIAGQFDHARRFNCRNPLASLAYVQSPSFDLFCCGHALMAGGRLLVAGGTADFPPTAAGIHHEMHFAGHRHAATFRAGAAGFTTVADMHREPDNPADNSGGRWYPTLCTLASGEVLALHGHPDDADTRHDNDTPERYQSLTGTWVLMPQFGVSWTPTLYPRTHLLRDGTVFISSPIAGFGKNVTLNPYTSTAQEVSPLPDGSYDGFAHPSVLLPLSPEDGYQPRVLLAGGAQSQFIDLGAVNPAWVTVPGNGGAGRGNSCATLLPTGDVLLTGGAVPGNDQSGMHAPALWDSPLNLQTRVWGSGVGSWSSIPEPAPSLRNYHSTALLLPDGRVWTAGGNSPTQPDQPPGTAQKTIEIFTPPYPAGPRPTITAAPKFLGYGDPFRMSVPHANQIGSVVLMRCGSSTHAFDADQRAVLLRFESSGNTITATAPPRGEVAPPGPYMFFVVDQQGRPCEYARFVRLGGRISMFTGRSHISLPEVQAQQPGTAYIPQALFVVLDGFTSADIASPERAFPPAITFQNAPGLRAEYVDALYEAPGAPDDEVQRITLTFQLAFDNANAFNGIPDGGERSVQVDVAWGPSTTSGTIVLYRGKHVYALDGPVPWLSIDTRVVKVPRHGMLNTVRNDDPVSFVQDLIDRFRTLPNTPFHPFQQLSQDINASKLELSSTVNGTLVDNFAFAKVRFRAPSGVDAHNVKVFFRLFITAMTNVGYDVDTSYPRTGDAANAVALQGSVGGAVVSIPFFANARAANPLAQTDPNNTLATLAGAGPTEVVAYFGAWLDFNHVTALRNLIRGPHQCLVSEIYLPPDPNPYPPIPEGATPTNHDQLSQRNLIIEESENPGGPAAHTIAHTFELKDPGARGRDPTEEVKHNTPAMLEDNTRWLSDELKDPAARGRIPVETVKDKNLYLQDRRWMPDELMLKWKGLPADAIATVFLPSQDMELALQLASYLRPGANSLSLVDAHTVQCRIGDVTYLPILPGGGANIPGLLTITLPPSVKTGTTYRVSAHQISGVQRRIIGSFDLLIPVSQAHLLLPGAHRDLGVLREIGATIPPGDRWAPVFSRYLDLLTDRVRGFGGDPDTPLEGGAGKGGQGHSATGLIQTVCYDRDGGFIGFVLDPGDGPLRFHANSERIHKIVTEAAAACHKVTVEWQEGQPDHAHGICVQTSDHCGEQT